MKRILFLALCAGAFAFAGCGDDEVNINLADAGNGGGGNGGGGTTDPGPGPANEVDATITGSGGETIELDGNADASTEGGSFDAYIFEGTLFVTLTSESGIVAFNVAPQPEQLPGTVSITGGPPEGTFVTVTSTAILESTGGAITINQCPTADAVFTGSFDNVALSNVITGGTDTLSGTFRATVRVDDGTITCAEPAGTGSGTGTGTGGGGGGGSCDLAVCDGPCCPLVDDVSACAVDCSEGVCNPMSPDFNMMDPTACFTCIAECDQLFLDDAACSGPYIALSECEAASTCEDQFDPFDDEEQYDACVETACCDEARAAF
jgi:hypothetical protein